MEAACACWSDVIIGALSFRFNAVGRLHSRATRGDKFRYRQSLLNRRGGRGIPRRTTAQRSRLRYGSRPQTEDALFTFDLLEVDGRDLRRESIELRKATLAKLLRKARMNLQLNEHIEEPGEIVFRHAGKLGFEGIVSKRLGSPYISGRSCDWLKFKNPAAPAVKREAEKDWGRDKWR
jgi:hypothetical protein